MYLSSLPPSVPSVPQNLSATSNGSTAVSVTWMEPDVFFREHLHNYSTVFACTDDMQ